MSRSMFMACSSRCWRSQACGSALFEGAAEVEARQAGIGSQGIEGDVRIAVRTQTFDGTEQDLRRKPTHGRLERGWRAGVGSQETCSQEICQLMPEQRIQGAITLQHIGRAQEQSGCNGVGMRRSLQEIGWCGRVGFTGNALEHCMWKIELNNIDRFRNIPSGA